MSFLISREEIDKRGKRNLVNNHAINLVARGWRDIELEQKKSELLNEFQVEEKDNPLSACSCIFLSLIVLGGLAKKTNSLPVKNQNITNNIERK